jgi:hypothetical protein
MCVLRVGLYVEAILGIWCYCCWVILKEGVLQCSRNSVRFRVGRDFISSVIVIVAMSSGRCVGFEWIGGGKSILES